MLPMLLRRAGSCRRQLLRPPGREFDAPASAPSLLKLFCSSRHLPFFSTVPTGNPKSANNIRGFHDDTRPADIEWDNIGFGLKPTDYMYVMKSTDGQIFEQGKLNPFGNIKLSPASAVINYGQGLFEGLKAYRNQSKKGGLLLFRPKENYLRMQAGADRLCMTYPTVEQFVQAVKETAAANKRWVPPAGKGALYIRPLLIGSGAVLEIRPAQDYTFLVFASPVGNYFKEGTEPLNLIVTDDFHRATRGGTGHVKTITNYAPCLKALRMARSQGFSDVLYLDSVEKRFLEEVSSCNIFLVKGNVVSTPALKGTVLPGVTRKSVVQLARGYGLQVEERQVAVEELEDADEVFCTGTAVVVAPVGSITYKGQRYKYKCGQGTLSEKLHATLTGIQTGLIEDSMGWTVEV